MGQAFFVFWDLQLLRSIRPNKICVRAPIVYGYFSLKLNWADVPPRSEGSTSNPSSVASL
jgi:hypothetical protein